MKITVDRLENDVVVCIDEAGSIVRVTAILFDIRPVEGNIYSFENKRPVFMAQETAAKKQSVQDRFNRLKKKS